MFQSLRKLSKPVKANWQVKFKRLTLKTLALQFIYSISLVTALLMELVSICGGIPRLA